MSGLRQVCVKDLEVGDIVKGYGRVVSVRPLIKIGFDSRNESFEPTAILQLEDEIEEFKFIKGSLQWAQVKAIQGEKVCHSSGNADVWEHHAPTAGWEESNE